jgi:hypothetical protein
VNQTVLSAASILPSWVNGDELLTYLGIQPKYYPIFVDLVRHNNTDFSIFWETINTLFYQCYNVECIYNSSYSMTLELSSTMLLGDANWTTDLIGAINFNNVLYQWTTSPVFDGYLDYSIVTSNVQYNISSVIISTFFQLYVFGTGSYTVTGCPSSSPFSLGLVWKCLPGSLINITFTGANISEVQGFSDDTRVPFYSFV